MVIEHEFVTTLEGPEAMRTASRFLTERGFAVQEQNAFAVGGGWTTLEVVRGRAKAASAKSVAELPQRLRMDFDRGRMTVAAVLEYYQRGSFGSSAREPKVGSKKVRDHAALLTAMVTGVELLLVQRVTPEQAGAEWARVEHQIVTEAAKKRRRRIIMVSILLAVIVGLIVFAAIMANSR